MTTTDANPGMSGLGQGPTIARVVEANRVQAADRLVAVSAGGQRDAGRRFLKAAAEHSVSLQHFWASIGARGEVREVCLAVPGAGRTAMVFVSSPDSHERQQEAADVVRKACGALEGLVLAQALLEAHETAPRRVLELAGFQSLDELIYLRRPRPAPREIGPASELIRQLPPGVELRSYTQRDESALKRALEETYIGTLDCPELCGVRSMEDVLDSHRASGRGDQSLWWLVIENGEVHGAVLFNPSPEQSSIELVYFGLAPSMRGRGLGTPLLKIALSQLAGRKEHVVCCAVDARNTPARKLYEKLGFSEFGRRKAMILPLAGAKRP